MSRGARAADPAFGMVELSRVSGRANLFMVDYPQDHYMVLRVHTAELERHLAGDHVYDRKVVIEVALSATQFAQLITSPNTRGVPCTLQTYRDPITGEMRRPRLPDEHAGTRETFSGEVQTAARKAAEGVSAVRAELDALLKGGPVKKGDLTVLAQKLERAQRSLDDSLPFVVSQAEEAIERRTHAAMGEVSAHIDYSLGKLGERALGDRLAQALENGVDPRHVGTSVMEALAPPAPITPTEEG